MIEQKIEVCNNVMEETCNIGTVYNNAQSIYDLKSEINKKIKTLSSTLPDNYVSPLLLFAEYHILANYSLYDYEKLGKLYLQRYFKYENQFKELGLTQENLYQDQNVFLILSGQKISSGQILHCSNSIQNLCGGERGSYVDQHVSSLFTPVLRSHYDDFFRQIFETGNRSLMNKKNKAFVYHKNKHIVEVEFFLRVHPFVTNSLRLQMMIRPLIVQNEYLLLREDGTIEGGTEKISQALGLNLSGNKNIRLFSEELARMNMAFNIIHRAQSGEKLGKSNHENLIGNLLKNKYSAASHMDQSSPVSALDQREATEIYELFTKGKRVDLKLHGQTQDRLIAKETGLKSTFYCKASFVSLSANTFMKVIELHHTAVGEDVMSSKRLEVLKGSSRVLGSFRTVDGIQRQRFSSSTEVEKMKFDEEEASENIDCNERETNNMTLMSPRRAMETGTDRGLLSPKAAGTERDLLSPKSLDNNSQMDFPLITATPRNNNNFEFAKKKVTGSYENSVETGEVTNFKKNGGDGDKKDQKMAPRYLSSQHSSVKGDRSSYKSFKAAIKSRSYPRSFTILCVVFYAVIIGTFISQIILKIVSDETMEDLVVKKNLLKNAEVFSYKAQQIQINAQAGALQIQGALVVNGAVSGMAGVLVNLKERVGALQKARLGMTQELTSLDSEFQAAVGKADIQMRGTFYASTDTSVVRNLTVFQAAEVLENAVHLILGLPNAVSKQGFEAFNFLGLNILDQFLTKCNEVTAYFANSVSEQKEFFQKVVSLCLVLTPFTLLGVALAFILIVWSQYRIGRNYMLIFVKLRQNGIKEIQVRLTNFRKNLKSGDLLSSKNYMNYFGELGTQMLDEKDQAYHKTNKNQVIIYTDYRRKYYSHVIRVVAYLSTLIAIMIWNYIATNHSTNVIYNKQSQLEFANYISTRISVGYSAFGTLYIKNNTLRVEGDTAYNVLVRGAKEIVEIQSEIPIRFMNEDGTYDARIKAYLFGKYLCEDMPTYPLYYCDLLRGKGLPLNMLPLVAQYASLISNKIRDFDNADRSTIGKILTAAYLNIETFLPQYIVITNEAQKMAAYIDASLADNIKIANDKRTQILIVFTVLLLIVSVLIWVNILRKLREVDNDFKKVLQVFPSKLVLSSFLLKMFLKKTSNDPLIL